MICMHQVCTFHLLLPSCDQTPLARLTEEARGNTRVIYDLGGIRTSFILTLK